MAASQHHRVASQTASLAQIIPGKMELGKKPGKMELPADKVAHEATDGSKEKNLATVEGHGHLRWR